VLVHPFDLLKVRKQLLSEGGGANVGLSTMARNIVQKEGVKGLYAGLSAAAARQLSYGNFRLGIYAELKTKMFGKENPTMGAKFGLGMTAGGIAAFLSNPVEVALVRMQADGRLPVDQQRGYRNVVVALKRIGMEEGASAYMAGAAPTVARAMLVNCLQLGGYDVFSTFYSENGVGGVPLHLVSAISAGFVYSTATLPLDTAKTRMQSQKPNSQGTCTTPSR
jgi:solute carrier family 25 oxoglutarate transporter 11